MGLQQGSLLGFNRQLCPQLTIRPGQPGLEPADSPGHDSGQAQRNKYQRSEIKLQGECTTAIVGD